MAVPFSFEFCSILVNLYKLGRMYCFLVPFLYIASQSEFLDVIQKCFPEVSEVLNEYVEPPNRTNLTPQGTVCGRRARVSIEVSPQFPWFENGNLNDSTWWRHHLRSDIGAVETWVSVTHLQRPDIQTKLDQIIHSNSSTNSKPSWSVIHTGYGRFPIYSSGVICR